MKIKSVHIQGMHNVEDKTYHLSNATYFYGENGAGKSTVLQAIQLALLGYIPGYNKTKEGIFRHANCSKMVVELTLDDDTTIMRSWQRKGKEIITMSSVDDTSKFLGGIELPILNFSEFTSMTANKLKDWFISFLPDADKAIDWYECMHRAVTGMKLTADSNNYLNDIETYANTLSGSSVQIVRDLNTYLKEQVSFKKGEHSRIQSTIQSLILYSDCDNSISIEDLKQRNLDLQKQRDALMKSVAELKSKSKQIDELKSVNSRIDQILDGISKEDIDSKLTDMINAIKSYDNQLTRLSVDHLTLIEKETQISEIVSGNGVCPYTKTVCSSIQQQIDRYKLQLNDITDQIDNLDNTTQKIHDEKNSVTCAYRELDAKRTTIEKLLSTRDILIAQIGDLYTSEVTVDVLGTIEPTIDKLNNQMRHNSDLIAKLTANQLYYATIDKITIEKYQIEQELEILKKLVKLTDVNGLQSELAIAPFRSFAECITKHLNGLCHTESMDAEFYITEKANSFSFGINRSGTYISYELLSSGEKCIFALALLLGITELSNAKLHMLMIDDMLDHLDDTKVSNVFDYLNHQNSVQVILAGVKPYIGEHADNIVITIA